MREKKGRNDKTEDLEEKGKRIEGKNKITNIKRPTREKKTSRWKN